MATSIDELFLSPQSRTCASLPHSDVASTNHNVAPTHPYAPELHEPATRTCREPTTSYAATEDGWSHIWAPLLGSELSPSYFPDFAILSENEDTTHSHDKAYERNVTAITGIQGVIASQTLLPDSKRKSALNTASSRPKTISTPQSPYNTQSTSDQLHWYTSWTMSQRTHPTLSLQPRTSETVNSIVPSASNRSACWTARIDPVTKVVFRAGEDVLVELSDIAADLYNRLLNSANTAYTTIHPLALRAGVLTRDLDQQLPTFKWVLAALLTGGAATAYLTTRRKALQQPPIPMLKDADPTQWRATTRTVTSLLKQSLGKNVQFRKDLEEARGRIEEMMEEIQDLKAQEQLLQELAERKEKLVENQTRASKANHGSETCSPKGIAGALSQEHHSTMEYHTSHPRMQERSTLRSSSTPKRPPLTPKELRSRAWFDAHIQANTPRLLNGEITTFESADSIWNERKAFRSTPPPKFQALRKRKIDDLDDNEDRRYGIVAPGVQELDKEQETMYANTVPRNVGHFTIPKTPIATAPSTSKRARVRGPAIVVYPAVATVGITQVTDPTERAASYAGASKSLRVEDQPNPRRSPRIKKVFMNEQAQSRRSEDATRE